MRGWKITVGFSLAVALALPLAHPAHAASRGPHVIPLTGVNATLGISDVNAKGPTPGDLRTLSLDLRNTREQPAGRVDIVQTLTRQEGDIGTAVKQVVISLPRGTITGLGQTQFSDITDPSSRPNDRSERIAITGGTGAYVGARGTVNIVVLPDFTSRWIISLAP